MQLAKGSWGLQIGAQQTDLVLLVMNRRGLEKLLEDKVSLGADASDRRRTGRPLSAATDAQLHAEILSYSRSSGLFAGIDLSGGVLRQDKEADGRAYGPGVSARGVPLARTSQLKRDTTRAPPASEKLSAVGEEGEVPMAR
jgi:SH3 domain-containing YSC84-like protein 1